MASSDPAGLSAVGGSNDFAQPNLDMPLSHVVDFSVALGELHSRYDDQQLPSQIFSLARNYIARVLHLTSSGFMSVSDTDSEFLWVRDESGEPSPSLKQDVVGLIDNGTFGWVLQQMRPVIIPGSSSGDIVLHPLASRMHIFGMFIGEMAAVDSSIRNFDLNILSIILFHSSYALENADLSHRITEYNRQLEVTIQTRTDALRLALKDAEKAPRLNYYPTG